MNARANRQLSARPHTAVLSVNAQHCSALAALLPLLPRRHCCVLCQTRARFPQPTGSQSREERRCCRLSDQLRAQPSCVAQGAQRATGCTGPHLGERCTLALDPQRRHARLLARRGDRIAREAPPAPHPDVAAVGRGWRGRGRRQLRRHARGTPREGPFLVDRGAAAKSLHAGHRSWLRPRGPVWQATLVLLA